MLLLLLAFTLLLENCFCSILTSEISAGIEGGRWTGIGAIAIEGTGEEEGTGGETGEEEGTGAEIGKEEGTGGGGGIEIGRGWRAVDIWDD